MLSHSADVNNKPQVHQIFYRDILLLIYILSLKSNEKHKILTD